MFTNTTHDYPLTYTKPKHAHANTPFRPQGLRFRSQGLRFRPVGLRFRPQALRFRPVGLRFRPQGLRFRPQGLRFRPVGLRFRPQGLRSSVFVFGSSFSTHPTFEIKIEQQRQFDTWIWSVTITQILQMEFNKKKIQR